MSFTSAAAINARDAVRRSPAMRGVSPPDVDLLAAAALSDITGIKLSLARGATVNAVDAEGRNAAHYAAESLIKHRNGTYYAQTLQQLQALGVNMTARTDNLITPLGAFMNAYRTACKERDEPVSLMPDGVEHVLDAGLEAFRQIGIDTRRYEQQTEVRSR